MKKAISTILIALAFAIIPTAIFAVGCDGGETQEETYTVTVVGGTLSDGKTTGEFEDGTQVTVKATVPEGKTFVNWTEGQTILSASAEYTFTVSYDITLTANFNAAAQVQDGVWILEAEAMNLDDYHGVGYSGGGDGAAAIQGANDAAIPQAAKDSLNKTDSEGNPYNDGFFVGFFNSEGTTFTFTFESDADAEDCTLTLRLGSEHGDMMFDPDLLTIKVNGEELDYEPFTVKGGVDVYGAFDDYTISTKIDLKANTVTGSDDMLDPDTGEVVFKRPVRVQNTIELILKKNNYWTTGNDPTGGPGIDCIKIESDSKISYTTLGEGDDLYIKDYWLGGWPEDFEKVGGEIAMLDRIGYVEENRT